MLNVFIHDASTLTGALIQARPDNMLSRRDHLENFVRSLSANPRLFPDVSRRLGEIAAPALVKRGRGDRFVPLDIGLRFLWGMQNAELHVFNHCGHWAQWEHTDLPLMIRSVGEGGVGAAIGGRVCRPSRRKACGTSHMSRT